MSASSRQVQGRSLALEILPERVDDLDDQSFLQIVHFHLFHADDVAQPAVQILADDELDRSRQHFIVAGENQVAYTAAEFGQVNALTRIGKKHLFDHVAQVVAAVGACYAPLSANAEWKVKKNRRAVASII